MILYDYHLHTNFSSDCDILPEEMIKSAINKGLKEIAVTDHMDFLYPDKNMPFTIIPSEYYPYLYELKEKYMDKINIKIGAELGYQDTAVDMLNNFCKEAPFDFLICSIHTISGLELYGDSYYKGKTKEEAFYGYFSYIKEGIKLFSDFDVFGHIDYVNRYGGYSDKSLEYEKYKDIIDDILKMLIERDKGIELNTSGIRYNLGYIHPKIEILKRYKELGGRIITVGSDSHKPSDIGFKFDDARKLLIETGFDKITVFEKRKPEFIKII